MKLLRGIQRGNPNKRKRWWWRRGKLCFWCGVAVKYIPAKRRRRHEREGTMPSNAATREHIQPKSQGGTPGNRNIVVACISCNGKRGTDTTWVPLHRTQPPKGEKGSNDGNAQAG